MWSLWNMAFDVGGETHYLHTSDIYQLQFNHFFYLKKSHHMKCMIGINSKSLNQTVFHIHICNKLPLSAKNPAWFFCLSFCDIYMRIFDMLFDWVVSICLRIASVIKEGQLLMCIEILYCWRILQVENCCCKCWTRIFFFCLIDVFCMLYLFAYIVPGHTWY